MADHEYPYLERPEKLEFPTETWGAHEIRKSDVFDLAAMCADDDDRARFIERGRFFLRTAVETLEHMPTRALARPVIVLLSSGLVASWFERHPDACMPDPKTAANHEEGGGHFSDFGLPERFVPQRGWAKRRLLVIAGSLALLSAIAVLLAWLA
jgi:hypothetical protein